MLTIVNEGSSLTIVNEPIVFPKTIVFIKTIVFEKKNLHATLLNVVLHAVKQLWGAKTS